MSTNPNPNKNMHYFLHGKEPYIRTRFFFKLLVTMKLIAFFTLFVGLHVSVAGYSQKIALSLKNEALSTVFTRIEQQSQYKFFYDNKLVKKSKRVSIDIKGNSIREILDEVLKDQSLSYTIVDNTIVIKRKVASGEEVRSTTPVQAGADAAATTMALSVNKLPGVEYKIQPSASLDISIRGKISDENGEGLPGVSILVKGTQRGTTTDIDGSFKLDVPDANSVLVLSYVGYIAQEVTVGTQQIINITLQAENKALNEVVVVGYGTQKKVNMTGAVDVIGNEKLANRQASTVSQLLQGLSPGLNFDIDGQGGFQPGASMNISVRGMGSLNGGSPFFVIDGFPGSIDDLNPEDIESVSVLKDAAASAIYGARAPYGVILVTTKKGKRNEKLKVTYSGNVFLNTAQNLPKSLDSYTWSRMQNEAGDNRGGRPVSNATIDNIIAYQNQDFATLDKFMPAGTQHYGAFPQGNIWNNANLNYGNTDWWDVYYGNSLNQKHDVTFSGGSNNINYYFSAGHISQKGILNFGTDAFNRTNVMGKINIAINDKWDFGWETRLSRRNRETPNMTNEGDYSFMFRHISRAYPITPLYDAWGNYMFESHIPSIIGGGTDRVTSLDNWNNFRTEIRPLKGWRINADFAYNAFSGVRNDVQKTVYIANVDHSLSPTGVTMPNHVNKTLTNNNYWTSNLFSTYDFNLGKKNSLTWLVGMQLEKGLDAMLSGYKTDLISNDITSLQVATGPSIVTESLPQRATAGYFSRLSFNHNDKYLLEVNGRYDGSYVFRKSKRWGFFPSLSLGWNIHNEAFWKNLEEHVSAFKIRASWGQLGNQQVAPYSDLELIPLQTGKLNWVFDYGQPRQIGYTTAPGIVNRNLTWETASTKNIGANIAFLRNKLQVDFDLFERITSNMIGPSPAKPGVLGAGVPNDNNATLRTRGWEVAVRWQQGFDNGFSYFANFNLSDNKSVVTKYFNPTGTLSNRYAGQTVGEIWGYQVNDLFRSQTEVDDYRKEKDLSFLGANWRPGDVRYEDSNNDGKVNNGANTIFDSGDMSIIGNDRPRFIYGTTVGASYRGFDISMLWRGVAKKDVYFGRMSNLYWGFTNGWWESTLTPEHLDYFRDQPGTKYSGLYEGDANINTDGYWPRPYLNSTEEAKNKNNPNTRYMQSAAYLRLQNAQIAYTVPKSITNKIKLQRIRVYLSGENLFTFSKLPRGMDPVAPVGFGEGGDGDYIGTKGTGRLTYGADRTFSLGINITY
jgi:TonB-linked SusC/RagA family outer membrane protein